MEYAICIISYLRPARNGIVTKQISLEISVKQADKGEQEWVNLILCRPLCGAAFCGFILLRD